MFRVHRIKDVRSQRNRRAVAQVQDIIRAQFPGMDEADIAKLPDQLENPLKYRFVSELFVATDTNENQSAFALLLFAPDLRFAYLDTISAKPDAAGRGLGAALYERVRDEARKLGASGLYFECLPDTEELSPNAKIRRQNAARLKFYERLGAFPIMGTAYETPVTMDATDPPYLVFDGLGGAALPKAESLRPIVRAILERKYGDVCPPRYIDKVVGSIRDGRFGLRAPRYLEKAPASGAAKAVGLVIPLIVNDGHEIHHVRDRGYVEAPVRVASILRELDKTQLFRRVASRRFSNRHIREAHDPALVDYIKHACQSTESGKSLYPYVFPIRNARRKPKERSVLAGYWCIDTFTPLNREAYPAARGAVNCALTAADLVHKGAPVAYALVRPPGHHAEYRVFGGFCYFNNAAIAAQYLSHHGKVAVLDIDYHHGNGTQDIFYTRSDVLTVSIHGNPSFAYPYFTGFADETGRGAGAGFNLNIALPEKVDAERYREALRTALRRIARFKPDYLVLAFGLDTAKEDPTGTWSHRAADFEVLGDMIGALPYPLVVVQEGGYRVRTLGVNARHFFNGIAAGFSRRKTPSGRRAVAAHKPIMADDVRLRRAVQVSDVDVIRRLVAGTGVFNSAELGIAAELVSERVQRGTQSGYEFVIAEAGEEVVGYACYGRIDGTEHSYDLYWIVVDPGAQHGGIGTLLLDAVESIVHDAGGGRIYVETSSRGDYGPARAFYRRAGYEVQAKLANFYGAHDNKIILAREVA